MKFGQVTELDKRNTATSKKIDDVVSTNCDVAIFFPKMLTSAKEADGGTKRYIF